MSTDTPKQYRVICKICLTVSAGARPPYNCHRCGGMLSMLPSSPELERRVQARIEQRAMMRERCQYIRDRAEQSE